MAQTYRNSMPFSYQVRWKLKSHYAKKLLAVCGMMTFDPKYSFESPFANIWGNNLFDSDNLSFDLIKKRFQILWSIFHLNLQQSHNFFSLNARSILYWQNFRSSDPFSSWTYNKVNSFSLNAIDPLFVNMYECFSNAVRIKCLISNTFLCVKQFLVIWLPSFYYDLWYL